MGSAASLRVIWETHCEVISGQRPTEEEAVLCGVQGEALSAEGLGKDLGAGQSLGGGMVVERPE